ncbi:hypothetical protein K491DRAFT_693382 [Lophiostoma macrostomum CBS 122681]|uniref:Calcium uniporter protein, mitochondrial n=1 Tax=Lophiostoma macrostomum CBS 122681 TaxID=1314788 RepID=A0A6A6T5K0_9PLEO|nr:hypothetical protein K491DRAFT_693382 [Lophiostoma macrostomum CBS 122681]
MKPRINPLGTLSRVSLSPRVSVTRLVRQPHASVRSRQRQSRSFTAAIRLGRDSNGYDNANARPAINLNHNITKEEEADYAQRLQEDKGKQIRTPWHREGSDVPPVARQRSAGAMTKGKLLTTPSRMLKLILPLTTHDTNTDRKDLEPLALLVHPQQPLSYLERLIQAELPTVERDGKERVPNVYFRAEDSMQDEIAPSKPEDTPVSMEGESVGESEEGAKGKEEQEDFETVDEIRIGNKTERTGKLSGGKGKDKDTSTAMPDSSATNRKTPSQAASLRGGHGEGGVESYSGLGQDSPADKQGKRKFVRWSSSTEIGDFIRDAARGQEFAVEIEGAPNDIRVGVPSFNDRTYYLRMRLRKTSKQIADMATIKEECDRLAHKGAQRVALGGFGILCGWWYLVYRLTFETDLGWDVMEPVTYLVGLSTLIGGYVWFLYHNREVSYRSAMNFTISKRQSKLYTQHKFDLRKWETLIEDGNALRKEIKAVANEYDVEWDEMTEEKNEKVVQALKNEREKRKGNKKGDAEEEGGEKDGEKDGK